MISLQGAKANTLPASLGLEELAGGPVRWAGAMISEARNLRRAGPMDQGAGKVGAGRGEPTIPCPSSRSTSSTEGWARVLTGLPQLSVCHQGVICTEHFLGFSLWGRWREKKPGTQGLETSGEEANLLFISHGISSHGVQQRRCERSESGKGLELTFQKYRALCLLLCMTTLMSPAKQVTYERSHLV